MASCIPLTIVMYHYVRDFSATRFPRIKGRDVAEFRHQLGDFQDRYTPVSMEEVIASLRGETDLPPDALLLTFDDGYLEHYTVVFPLLMEAGLTGAFFPPVAPVARRDLLDVNRVHFLLACVSADQLVAQMEAALGRDRQAEGLEELETYRNRWRHPNRFDDADTVYLKRMLQTALPKSYRHKLAREMFAAHVTVDETAFAEELYVSEAQLKVMRANGMHMGSHGDSHVWMGHLSRAEQEAEIDQSLAFLKRLGCPVRDYWTLCYPYGSWNQELLDVVRARNCTLGVTTEFKKADLATHDPLLLPRLDTNDFPITAS